jgi:protein-disulfide isomerase
MAALIVYSNNSNANINKIDINAIQPANSQDGNIADHVFGNANSKVTLINYGDFQCPGCGTEHPRMKAIVEQYKDQIRFVFRNFPIPTLHPNAKAAAGAAEAASLQGKYWEMHDKIYESQSAWENLDGSDRTDLFVDYATELGLDTSKFKADMASEAVSKKIAYDYSLGHKAGIDSTPSFYLNGIKLDSSVWGDNTKLKAAINTELKKADIAPPQPTK